MITHTALFLILGIYLLVPVLLYSLPHKRIAQFCFYMTGSENCRKFYCMMLLLGVIYMHFAYYNGHRGEYGLMVSTLIMLAMFSKRLTESLLKLLADDNRKLWAFAVMTVAIGFIPHMLTTAMTLAILVAGASFYPSKKIRSIDGSYLLALFNKAIITNDYKAFVQTYFK